MKVLTNVEVTAVAPTERTKIVYTQAPLQLARLVGATDEGYRVELGGHERIALRAQDVDPALLQEVLQRQGRVLLEVTEGTARIAGVIQTRRTLEIDESGDVVANLRNMRVKVQQEIQLTTERAFVWLKNEDVEIYGKEVLTRAREVAKILGRLISLN